LIRRINLYLLRQIFTAFLFSGIAVSFVVLFTQSFRLLSFVIDNSSTLFVFFRLMGLIVPTFLPLIVPISFGIAVLFIYHKFAVDSELVVMRAAGLSPLRMAFPALLLGVLVVLLGYGLTLWITPAANRSLVNLQYRVRDDYSAYMIRPGAFNDLAEGLTFYARRRSSGGGMADILVHDVRDPAFPVTIMAQSGQMTFEDGIPQVVVFNGRRQELSVETGRLQELGFNRYVLDLHLLKNDGPDRQPAPREMSLPHLWKTLYGNGHNFHSKGKVRAELHQRVAGPLLALSFALIAVTVILVGDFNRRGMTQRVLVAAAAIVVVQALMLGLVSQVARQAWLAPILYLVVLAPVPVCLSLLDMKSTIFRRLRAFLSRLGERA